MKSPTVAVCDRAIPMVAGRKFSSTAGHMAFVMGDVAVRQVHSEYVALSLPVMSYSLTYQYEACTVDLLYLRP
jgi:hypothetical protein